MTIDISQRLKNRDPQYSSAREYSLKIDGELVSDIIEARMEIDRLRAALKPFAAIGEGLHAANLKSGQSTLIGASARFLKLEPLTGQDFVNAYRALQQSERTCHKCGSPTGGEEALVKGEIWCHPCADNA